MSGAGTVLVVAKAPVVGRVKTRLAASIGADAAARIAAASLQDTIEACAGAVGPENCCLALAGDLDAAHDGAVLRSALAGWSVVPQQGHGLGERIAAAFEHSPGPTVQIGMDTPQVSAELLGAAMAQVTQRRAVLGPAADGGWWLLGLAEPKAAGVLTAVPMSRPDTGHRTRQALVDAGLQVADAPVLRDIDELDDLLAVAADLPESRTARTAAAVLA